MARKRNLVYSPPLPQADSSDESQHPCSRQPKELCDGARLAVQPDGTSHRVPALTPRAFCEPCERRIAACLGELPSAHERLEAAIASPVRRTSPVRVTPGSRVLVSAGEFDLMSTLSAVLGGWAARVRRVPGLQLADPGHRPGSPEAVAADVDVLVKHATPLLSLRDGWTLRTFTYPPPVVEETADCRHCGRRIVRDRTREKIPGRHHVEWWLAGKADGPVFCRHEPPDGTGPERGDVIPAHLLDLIGDREIVRQGDGWVTVLDELDGAAAGNEILKLHWDARRLLGEVKARPETFDGIPCRSCEVMALERAEPPSDPNLDANHSKCPECGDEMDRETFAQWADTYSQWAKGAGIRECKRCTLAERAGTQEDRDRLHADCCWAGCSCGLGTHPRRPVAA